MNNERLVKFALVSKVEGKERIGNPKISRLPTALKRCGLNLREAIETANNHSDWKRLHQYVGANAPPIKQK